MDTRVFKKHVRRKRQNLRQQARITLFRDACSRGFLHMHRCDVMCLLECQHSANWHHALYNAGFDPELKSNCLHARGATTGTAYTHTIACPHRCPPYVCKPSGRKLSWDVPRGTGVSTRICMQHVAWTGPRMSQKSHFDFFSCTRCLHLCTLQLQSETARMNSFVPDP